MSGAYGHDHQVRRAQLLPGAYGRPCPRCGKPMLRGQELDLGHTDDVAFGNDGPGDRIEHADCNRSAGAVLGNTLDRLAPSRDWWSGS